MLPTPKFIPKLDPGFIPAALWNRGFRRQAAGCGHPLAIALERGDGSTSVFRTTVMPHEGAGAALNEKYVERLVKFLLWQKGAWRVRISGNPRIAAHIASVYSPSGTRAFDFRFMGESVYGRTASFEHMQDADVPGEKETVAPLGRHLEGCRIGFDLGASDRKAAAVIDGQVVFSEEVPWDPSRRTDPQYHFDGINDSLKRAAAKLPRVDAIGGSAAGVYVNNEVRIGSLYRGVPRDQFDGRIRRLFFELQKAWGGIPFEVVNDGEVTALAGSMALGDNAVLGVAFGSSLAAGYVTPQGNITGWLNELAFVPVDYRDHAPADEWSGDVGVGVQYFSQQAVARLAPLAGLEFSKEMPFPERLVEVQKLMAAGDARARSIYETIGVYFGYTIAHFADFYQIRNLLVLGRVMTGQGGDLILEMAGKVLREEFPDMAAGIRFHVPGETEKRHGQAVAAASLPALVR